MWTWFLDTESLLPEVLACSLFGKAYSANGNVPYKTTTVCCGILITPLAGSSKSNGLYLNDVTTWFNPIQQSIAMYSSHT